MNGLAFRRGSDCTTPRIQISLPRLPIACIRRLGLAGQGAQNCVGRAVTLGRRRRTSVMLPLISSSVSRRRRGILVRGDDRAVEVELDHGLGQADRGNLAGICVLRSFRADVGGELDHPVRPPFIEDGIVGGLDPDLRPPLAMRLYSAA